ncbi:LicD family protein [[Ruminococcus] torques]|uniref:LicD family protein n=1 Tax=[Ruminococcus] torques TaxID=33039 RepID=UPI003079BD8B
MSKLKAIIKKIKIIYVPWHAIRLTLNESKEKKKKKAYIKYGNEALTKICNIVQDNHFKIAATEGTLLGLIRDQQLIPWDDDLDFLIIDDGNIDWERLENALTHAGFWKYREKRSQEELLSQAYKYKGVHCDFVKWELGEDTIKINYGCYEYQDKVYLNDVEAEYQVWEMEIPSVQEIEFRKIARGNIPVPKNSEEILTAIYGEWKVPDSKYRPNRVEISKKFKFTYYYKNGKIRKFM